MLFRILTLAYFVVCYHVVGVVVSLVGSPTVAFSIIPYIQSNFCTSSFYDYPNCYCASPRSNDKVNCLSIDNQVCSGGDNTTSQKNCINRGFATGHCEHGSTESCKLDYCAIQNKDIFTVRKGDKACFCQNGFLAFDEESSLINIAYAVHELQVQLRASLCKLQQPKKV